MSRRPQPGRRRALRAIGAGLAWVIVRPAGATPADLATALRELFGKRPMQSGRIALQVPRLAENGYIVPITVVVDSPMTEQDYVKRVHLFAPDNPVVRVLDFELSPENGRARVSTRIRVAVSQQLHAVAEMSDGSLWTTAVDIEVTVGGCAP